MQGVVPKLSETPGEVRHAGQALGESNEAIYGELLGMGSAEMEELRRDGVI
jgi:crotonobetainyl-CoA:carnitine CoA-transferase CaiB-like acyl-CoA transferase